jgi:hypothetical protein
VLFITLTKYIIGAIIIVMMQGEMKGEGFEMTKEHYMKFLRMLAVATAAVLWAISVSFSVDGFNIQVKDMVWVGVVLALSVTAIELIWNKSGMGMSLTLVMGGLLAYAYGVYTNIIGIMGAQGISDPMNQMGAAAFAVILGLVLEILPEPLFVWGLVGDEVSGDLLSNIFGKVGSSAGRAPDRQMLHGAQPTKIKTSFMEIPSNGNGKMPGKYN